MIISSGWQKDDISYNSGEDYTFGYDFQQTGYLGFAASMIYTPFSGNGSFFKLKSGFLMGTMAHSYGGIREGGYPMTYAEFAKENLIGLLHTVNLRFLDKERIFVGTELSMLTSFSEGYYNCDGFVLNFMVGVKL